MRATRIFSSNATNGCLTASSQNELPNLLENFLQPLVPSNSIQLDSALGLLRVQISKDNKLDIIEKLQTIGVCDLRGEFRKLKKQYQINRADFDEKLVKDKMHYSSMLNTLKDHCYEFEHNEKTDEVLLIFSEAKTTIIEARLKVLGIEKLIKEETFDGIELAYSVDILKLLERVRNEELSQEKASSSYSN